MLAMFSEEVFFNMVIAGCRVAHFGHSLKGLCVEMGSLAFGLSSNCNEHMYI